MKWSPKRIKLLLPVLPVTAKEYSGERYDKVTYYYTEVHHPDFSLPLKVWRLTRSKVVSPRYPESQCFFPLDAWEEDKASSHELSVWYWDTQNDIFVHRQAMIFKHIRGNLGVLYFTTQSELNLIPETSRYDEIYGGPR